MKQNEDFGVVIPILIDMQQKFVNCLREGGHEILIRQLNVIRFCAKYDIPLVVLRFKGMGVTLPDLQKEIKKIPRTRDFVKINQSGFGNKGLLKQLKKWGANTLLLMGIYEDDCVKQTARDAIKNGFKIATSPQLISGPIDHEYDNLLWYKEKGIFVQDYIELIKLLFPGYEI